MKVFLLAAGKGSRISKNIPEIPKCTLDINGQPLLLHTISLWKQNGVTDITVVVGYKHEIIENLLKGMNITIVQNPFFDITNSIASLWMAQNYFSSEEDTVIANADVFITQEIIDCILSKPKKIFLLSDISHAEDGDYFFNTNPDNTINAYGKDLTRKNRTCEYVGVAYINKDFIDNFLNRMNELINEGKHGVWWENILYSFINDFPVFALDVQGKFWAEVDYIEDYQRIINFVQSADYQREK